jgi:hypothetical protein
LRFKVIRVLLFDSWVAEALFESIELLSRENCALMLVNYLSHLWLREWISWNYGISLMKWFLSKYCRVSFGSSEQSSSLPDQSHLFLESQFNLLLVVRVLLRGVRMLTSWRWLLRLLLLRRFIWNTLQTLRLLPRLWVGTIEWIRLNLFLRQRIWLGCFCWSRCSSSVSSI